MQMMIGETMELAQIDDALCTDAWAAGFIEARGRVHRNSAGEGAYNAYTRRDAMPTSTTVDALISSFAPPRIERGSLAPNKYALEAKRQREQQKATRRASLFRK